MDVSAIARTKDDFVAALRNGDAVAASAIYADDAQLLAPHAGSQEKSSQQNVFPATSITCGTTGVMK